MIPKKSLKYLNLSEEQLEIYKKLEAKEQVLKQALIRCGVKQVAVNKIIDLTDLTQIPDNENILDEQIKEAWGDFIYFSDEEKKDSVLITRKNGKTEQYTKEYARKAGIIK